MTASAPKALWPGRAAFAGRPAGALWVLLLVGLLTALPCAGQAKAVTAERESAVPVVLGTAAGPDGTGPDALAAGPAAPGASAAPWTPDLAPQPAAHGEHVSHLDATARHWTWCSADGRPPSRNDGCSGHPFCTQDAQLPNPPPQPVPAAAPRPAATEALPRVLPCGLLVGPHPAPDLYALQVHRS
ncbi:hypothetical protein ACWEQL_19655 [Kitasatospora sp. NPDC004240]